MSKMAAVYATAAGIAVLAVAIIVLNSPVDDMYSDLPPMMLLVADSGEYEAGVGSFCGQVAPFANRCVDRTLEGSLPGEIVILAHGSAFEVLVVDYPHPEILQAILHSVDFDMMEFEPAQVSQAGFVADFPRGDYVLAFFAKWDDASMGDSSYYYRISVV